ncbi:hypothetical protein IMCC1933_13190 [Rhodobacteraceae bacterium IMCC1933]|nr:hypothetical protein [Rhodobacteraceae bacterium IMCC1923]MDP4067773.1 hypothetical protein [Rhodobacteraceae bacterium IMCC1933]MDP4070973.1 hypothetical protein [Rhodobacteraceae bacterium IMCC1909]
MVKSLQNLCNNHTSLYIEMVNAPAGGRQAQPGVATGQSVLAWQLGCYAEVFLDRNARDPDLPNGPVIAHHDRGKQALPEIIGMFIALGYCGC